MSETLYELLKARNDFSNGDILWDIRKSVGCGQGLFATRNIEIGELIFKDVPIVLGPRSSGQLPACVTCLYVGKPLRNCSKNCHLPVCSETCENDISHHTECQFLQNIPIENDNWSPLLYHSLTAIRCLLLSEKDRNIVNQLHFNRNSNVQKQVEHIKKALGGSLKKEDELWLEHCCGVLDGTAFEIEQTKLKVSWSLRGLYPLSAMMNHDCSPNTRHCFTNGSTGITMAVVASKSIGEGEEITTHYCPLLWASSPRRLFLESTKQFLCSCKRCQDPTEFGTNLSAVNCPCKGLIRPVFPLDLQANWKCDTCLKSITAKEVAIAQSLAAKMHPDEMDLILPECNAIKVQMKLQKIQELGGTNTLTGLTEEELNYKENLGKDLLNLIKKLQLGDSRMKGLISYDLYRTLKEKTLRNINVNTEELNTILRSAKDILKYDVTAPMIED